jgi:hypothetical protein
MLGIDDPYIWLGYLASILSALGCLVYGAYYWREGDEAKTVKSSSKKTVTQDGDPIPANLE